MSIAANEARQLLRQRRRRQVTEITVETWPEGAEPHGDRVDDRARELYLINALRRLPAEDRAVVAMRYDLGLSSSEIGRATGLSATGVRSRLAAPSSDSGRTSGMTDHELDAMDEFGLRLGRELHALSGRALRPFDAAAIAHEVAGPASRRPLPLGGMVLSSTRWLLVVLLALSSAVGALGWRSASSRHRRRSLHQGASPSPATTTSTSRPPMAAAGS